MNHTKQGFLGTQNDFSSKLDPSELLMTINGANDNDDLAITVNDNSNLGTIGGNGNADIPLKLKKSHLL